VVVSSLNSPRKYAFVSEVVQTRGFTINDLMDVGHAQGFQDVPSVVPLENTLSPHFVSWLNASGWIMRFAYAD